MRLQPVQYLVQIFESEALSFKTGASSARTFHAVPSLWFTKLICNTDMLSSHNLQSWQQALLHCSKDT